MGAGRRCGEETGCQAGWRDLRQRCRGPTRPDFPGWVRLPGWVHQAASWLPLAVLSRAPRLRSRQRPQEGKNLPGGHGCRSLHWTLLLLLEGGRT